MILDSELLHGLPQSVLGYAAMDAFIQAYESYISKNATWFSKQFSLKAIELINNNIVSAYESGTDENLQNLLVGSYCAGIALAAARLGVIHGIAHPLGAIYELPHGLVCSICFIPSIRINRKAMGKKYNDLSALVGMDFIKKVETLLSRLNIVSPFKGEEIIEKEKIIAETLQSGSTAANPKKIEREDIEELFRYIF